MFQKKLAIVIVAILTWGSLSPAIWANDKFWVEVTIHEFAFLGRMSETPDPYAIIDIAGQKVKTKRMDDKKSGKPNWSFGTILDGSKLTSGRGVRVAMALKDYDSTSRDDAMDINPAHKRTSLQMSLRLNFSGAVGSTAGELRNETNKIVANLKRLNTDCWQTNRISITGAGDDNRSRIDFTVEVIRLRKTFLKVPTDQPQDDSWSCGPNSISRVLRFYGIDASYSRVRSFTRRDGNLVSRAGLGSPPSAMIDAFRHWKRDARREDASRVNRVVQILQEGKPVIVLVSMKKNDEGLLGHFGKMHYLVINGYDPITDKFNYTNTNGRTGSWSRAEFENRWNWQNHYTGVGGETAQGALEALGLRKRTLFY